MANVRNYPNFQGAWGNTEVYAAKQVAAPTFDGVLLVSCPLVEYTDGKTYIYESLSPSTAGVTPPTGGSGWTVFGATGSSGSGTVTSFSATDGGGFDFTVTNPTTTPTLTAKPSFTGFAYSDGTTYQAAGTAGVGSALALTTTLTSVTPTITCATPGDLSITYSTGVGSYSQVGNLATVTFQIETSAFTHTTAAGTVTIAFSGSLPTIASGVKCYGAVQLSGYTKADYTQATLMISSAGVQIQMSGSAQASALLAITDLPTAGTVIISGTVSYLTA